MNVRRVGRIHYIGAGMLTGFVGGVLLTLYVLGIVATF